MHTARFTVSVSRTNKNNYDIIHGPSLTSRDKTQLSSTQLNSTPAQFFFGDFMPHRLHAAYV